MGKSVQMIGKRFERLTVIAEGERNRWGQTTFVCICDCGNVTNPINISNLRRTKSCGCWKTDRLRKRIALKHEDSNSRLYKVWQGMKQRCSNPRHDAFCYYGGRGISVCEEWNGSYDAFRKWAIASGYSPDAKRGDCTIDRIDVNGDYCPENCRWVSMKVQQNNKRNNRRETDD